MKIIINDESQFFWFTRGRVMHVKCLIELLHYIIYIVLRVLLFQLLKKRGMQEV